MKSHQHYTAAEDLLKLASETPSRNSTEAKERATARAAVHAQLAKVAFMAETTPEELGFTDGDAWHAALERE